MTQFLVQVVVGDSTDPRRLDDLTGRLARDLRAIRELSVRPEVTPSLPGSKSATLGQIGTLAVSGLLSAAGLGALRDIIVAYLQRSGARAVTVRAGDREVVLTGISAADLSAVTSELRTLMRDADSPNGPA